MELQISDLVSAIKKEGFEAARAEADRILAEAKAQAAEIVAEAKKRAAQEKEQAASEIATLRESARVDAEQAKRDAVLSFKTAVQAEFEKLLAADTRKSVKGETLAKLIIAALGEGNPGDYAAEVAEITEGLQGELAEALKNGLELRVTKSVRGGFRLSAKDGSGYFDCSDEEITKMLLAFYSGLSI